MVQEPERSGLPERPSTAWGFQIDRGRNPGQRTILMLPGLFGGRPLEALRLLRFPSEQVDSFRTGRF